MCHNIAVDLAHPGSPRLIYDEGEKMVTGWFKSTTFYILFASVLVALFPLTRPGDYLLSFLFLVFMYASLAVGWNIIGGFAGYLSFGHAAFFGLGGYITGLALFYADWSPFVTALPAAALVGLFAALVGYPVLRLRGPYFALVTMTLTMMLRIFFTNVEWTQGSQGVFLPFPPFDRQTGQVVFYLVMLAILVVTLLIARWVQHSKLGIGLVMIRDDEDAAQTLGVNATALKLIAFSLSAGLAGLVGGIFVYYRTYVQPSTVFDVFLSVSVVLMALLGGRHSWAGPLIGAIILSVVGEILTLSFNAEIARVAFGVLLIVVIMLAPNGLLGLAHLPAVASGMERMQRRWRPEPQMKADEG
jgi:branched-chain amino acid transport system permease protein